MLALSNPNPLDSGRYIINHDIMNCTADGVVANHLYSGRALGISEPWDLVQLHPDLQPLWHDIKSHYSRIGLTHSENIIWNIKLDELAAHPGYQPSVFYFGPDENKHYNDKQWLAAVEHINSKNNFMALAKELGVDTPLTLCYANKTDIDNSQLKRVPYPCYLKAAVSVSGVGIYRCENEAQLKQSLECFNAQTPIQIQQEVIAESFLNLQYQVEDDRLIRLEASEQILDGFTHQGNRVPASAQPWDSVEPMAQWLMDNGIKGIFAFDVAVVKTAQGNWFPAIECNPRFNGASYPTLIAKKLNIAQWCSLTLDTQYRKLNQLKLQDIEYNPDSEQGLVLINWGTILEGKLMILLAGPENVQKELLLALDDRL